MNLEQALSGRQQPPETRWSLWHPLNGQSSNFSAANQQIQHSQASHVAKVLTANGMDPRSLENEFGTIFEWAPTASRPRGCLQVRFKGPRLQLLAESQRTQHSQPPRTRQKLNPPMRWTHHCSKMNLEQSLPGSQQPPGTRWSLKLPLSVQDPKPLLGTKESSRLGPAPPGKSSNPLDDGPMATLK